MMKDTEKKYAEMEKRLAELEATVAGAKTGRVVFNQRANSAPPAGGVDTTALGIADAMYEIQIDGVRFLIPIYNG